MEVILKLSKTIKDLHEVELAFLEVEALACSPQRIRNLADLLVDGPLDHFKDVEPESPRVEGTRFQDYLLYELPYGPVQGLHLTLDDGRVLSRLQRRVAYSQEIYAVLETTAEAELHTVGITGIDKQVFRGRRLTLVRLITHQFYLENSEYVQRIARNLPLISIDEFVDQIICGRFFQIRRIPASLNARVGKRLLDYVAERREPSRHLAHGLYPYKGRFHPRLARSLINIIHPTEEGVVVDSFVGSGTSLLEANLMGIDALGVDISPLAGLISQAKADSLSIRRVDIRRFVTAFESIISSLEKSELDSMTNKPSQELSSSEISGPLLGILLQYMPQDVIDQFLMTRSKISAYGGNVKSLLLLSLAVAASRSKTKKNPNCAKEFSDACRSVAVTSWACNTLREKLGLRFGTSEVIVGDSSELELPVEQNRLRSCLNSPPYSTAIDYIGNDLPQLILLGLLDDMGSLDELDQRMVGNPRLRKTRSSFNANGLTGYARSLTETLSEYGRRRDAQNLVRFYRFLEKSFMKQVHGLSNGSFLCVVLGNNHLKISDKNLSNKSVSKSGIHIAVEFVEHLLRRFEPLTLRGDEISDRRPPFSTLRATINAKGRTKSQLGTFLEIENDRVLLEIAERSGLRAELTVKRPIQKTLRGNIRYETIIILRKPELLKPSTENLVDGSDTIAEDDVRFIQEILL